MAITTDPGSPGIVGPHPGPDPRHTGLSRALRLDLRLQRPTLLSYLIVAVIFTLLALVGARFGFFVILWAACMPVFLGRADRPETRGLRAALGVSRADAVRARTAVLVLAQLVLMVLAALILLLAPDPSTVDEPSMVAQHEFATDVYMTVPSAHFWSDVLTWSTAIVVVHVMTGHEALRRATWLQTIGAVACYFGAYAIMEGLDFLVSLGVDAVYGRDPWGQDASVGHDGLFAIAHVVYLLAAFGALWWRSRAWARKA
jgi:hypothetical protein